MGFLAKALNPDASIPGFLLLSISAVLAGGSLQMGFSIGCMANVIPIIGKVFDLSDVVISLIVSGIAIGGLFGSMIAGYVADIFGRKKVMMVNVIPMIFGTLLQAAAQNQYFLIFGRIISGFAVGVGSTLTPMYLQEISTLRSRGMVGTCHGVTLTSGILLGYLFSIPQLIGDLNTSGISWRVFMAIPIIPALYQTLILLCCPESPRWLCQQNNVQQAAIELSKLRGCKREEVEEEIRGMREEKTGEENVTLFHVIKNPVLRLALFIGIGLHGSQQLSGINVVLSYSPQIFSQASVHNPAIPTVITGCVNVASALSTVVLVDKLGRRPLLLGGLLLMAVSYFGVGIAQTCHVTGKCGGDWTGPFSIFMVCCFIIGFASTLGNIPWFMVGELVPTSARGTVNSVCVAFNWIFNLSIVFTYDSINRAIAPYTFFLYMAIVIFFLIFNFLFVPETKVKTWDAVNGELKEQAARCPPILVNKSVIQTTA